MGGITVSPPHLEICIYLPTKSQLLSLLTPLQLAFGPSVIVAHSPLRIRQ